MVFNSLSQNCKSIPLAYCVFCLCYLFNGFVVWPIDGRTYWLRAWFCKVWSCVSIQKCELNTIGLCTQYMSAIIPFSLGHLNSNVKSCLWSDFFKHISALKIKDSGTFQAGADHFFIIRGACDVQKFPKAIILPNHCATTHVKKNLSAKPWKVHLDHT